MRNSPVTRSRILRDRNASAFRPFPWQTVVPEDGPEATPAQLAESGLESALQDEVAVLKSRLRENAQAAEQKIAEAYRKGQEESRAAGKKQLDQSIAGLKEAIEGFANHRAKTDREAQDTVVQVSMAIARRILHRELTVSPDALSGLVASALESIRAQEIQRVICHPDLKPGVAKALEGLRTSRTLEVVANNALPPGSLKFEMVHGYLDASIDTQLSEIERGLTDRLRSRI